MSANVIHPTDRPNFCQVRLCEGTVTIWFSYQTPIAVSGPAGSAVRQNEWGPTTGKHLAYIDGGGATAKASRIDGEKFAMLLRDNLISLGLPAGVTP